MDNLFKDFDQLLNDTPIDDANRAQSQTHIEELIKEEIGEAQTGVIHTNKGYLTLRIKEAATRSIKERMGRWVSLRNDVLLRAKEQKTKTSASKVDIKERELIEEFEESKSHLNEEFMRDSHYSDKKAEFEQTKNLYETTRAELGGKPPVKRKFFLYIFSILVVGAVEWFINFSTFNIKYPPGVAAGCTILIALSIAFASHFHGALIKQRMALFAPHRLSREKQQVVYIQIIFSFLLFISLGLVTWARYDVLQDQLVNNGGAALPGLPGMAGAAATVWDELVPFVLMNLLVWLVGVAISYLIHDPRPDYQEALSHYEKAKKQFFNVDKRLKEQTKRIEAEFKEKLDRFKNAQANKNNQQDTVSEYSVRLEAKEDSLINQAITNINETFERHQSMLVTALRQAGFDSVTIGPDQLKLEQYLNKDLKMDVQEVRAFLALEKII